MPEQDSGNFHRTATSFSKNPLGIIALFIILIYSISSIVILCGSYLSFYERIPIVYFLITFPFVVLICFTYLVAFKSIHLFSPTDFRDQQHYIFIHETEMKIVEKLNTARENKLQSNNKETEYASLSSVQNSMYAQLTIERAAKMSLDRSAKFDILWVDDEPAQNRYERDALEIIGARFVNVETTNDALSLLKNNVFSAIISDMGRREGNREGYVLLNELKKTGIRTPFFLYTSSNSHEHRMEALRNGAQGATNNPDEIFQMIVNTVGQQGDHKIARSGPSWR